MKILLIYPLLAVILSASCGSTKEASTSTSTGTTSSADSKNNSGGTTANTSTTTGDATMKNDTNYRLIVSFISIGEGIDSKARESMDSMINSLKERKKSSITMEIMPWGREGEVDYCFKLNELSEKEREDFVSEVKTQFKGNNLVQIAENQPARHKR